jgi:hypothetical protein
MYSHLKAQPALPVDTTKQAKEIIHRPIKAGLGEWIYPHTEIKFGRFVDGDESDSYTATLETPDDIETVWAYYADNLPPLNATEDQLKKESAPNSQRIQWPAEGWQFSTGTSLYIKLSPEQPFRQAVILQREKENVLFITLTQETPEVKAGDVKVGDPARPTAIEIVKWKNGPDQL